MAHIFLEMSCQAVLVLGRPYLLAEEKMTTLLLFPLQNEYEATNPEGDSC